MCFYLFSLKQYLTCTWIHVESWWPQNPCDKRFQSCRRYSNFYVQSDGKLSDQTQKQTVRAPGPSLCMGAKSPQTCQTLCDPMEHSPPGSSVHGIRQKYWSGLLHPPPGDLSHPGIEPTSLIFPASAGWFFITSMPGKPNPSLSGQTRKSLIEFS